MKPRHILLLAALLLAALLLAALLLAACTWLSGTPKSWIQLTNEAVMATNDVVRTRVGATETAAAATPTPGANQQALDGAIPAGGIVQFTPLPRVGTPEANPHMILYGSIVDDESGQPLEADVLVGWEGDVLDVVGRDVDQFTIELPGQALDPIQLSVQAEGYGLWSQSLRYELQYTRGFTIVVRLIQEK
jgi:ABC-type amino acid transport substrate-binding protein